MAKEITVTFQNGGIFNGVASSYTLNGETTYYFDIDKRYRVVVTDGGQILSQQYQNTNGAWYNIDIISKVVIKDISDSNVTLEYLKENYYSKNESDGKYVKKAGDTMTGNLTFKNNKGIWFNGEAGTEKENYAFLFCYNGLYRETNTPTTEEFQFRTRTRFSSYTYFDAVLYLSNNAWLLFVDDDMKYRFSFSGNDMHIYNNGRIYLHSGAQDTVEPYIVVRESGISAANGAILNFNIPTAYNDTASFNNRVFIRGAATFDGDIIANATVKVDKSSTSDYVLIDGDQVLISDGSNSLSLRKGNFTISESGQSRVSFSSNRGMDLYNGRSVIVHGGSNDQQSAYTYNGINTYNYSNNVPWTINAGGARLEAYFYSSLIQTTSVNALKSTTGDVYLYGSAGTISANNLPKAVSGQFLSQSFLNALNQVLVFILQNMNKTYYVEFSQETFGGGFVAGGGSSRGGGVGRR